MPSPANKNGYILPHLRGKIPPKALTSDDINNDSLFPGLSPSSPKSPMEFLKNSIDFSHILKNEPILPTVVVKDRTVLWTHPLMKVIVYDMSDEDVSIFKGDPSFFLDLDPPTKNKKKSLFSLLDDYIEDNNSYISEDDYV
jgi:hypothetical protein